MQTHPYIQPGDGLATHNFFSFFRPLSLLSLTIRLFTRCYWNHLACVEEIDGELYVIEAWWPRCKATPLQEWLDAGKKDILRLRPKGGYVRDFHRRVLLDAAGISELGNRPGIRYDLSALFAQAGFRLRKKQAWRGRGEGTAHLKYYCSELFMRAHNRRGWWQAAPVEAVEDPGFEQMILRSHRFGRYV